MQEQQYKMRINELECEVRELEEFVALALNKKLLKELAEELKKIQNGEN